MARFATGNPADALDIVQDAMFGLVDRYAALPEEEWAPLFHRILQSRIRDWQRRRQVRRWLMLADRDHEDAGSRVDSAVSMHPHGDPEGRLAALQFGERLQEALETLPWRQQQAFLLRAWEGLDTRETAAAMACSEGSVKTHYSRAMQRLRAALEEFQA